MLGLIDIIYFLNLFFKQKAKKALKKDFEQEKNIVESQFQTKLTQRIEAERIVYDTSIAVLKERQSAILKEIDKVSLEYDNKLKELNSSFVSVKQQLDLQKEELMKKKDEEFASNLQLKQQLFSEKEREIQEQFDEKFNFLDNTYTEKMKKYHEQFLEYENKIEEQKKLQEEVVSRLKRDEEVREQQDFYRVKLDSNSIGDISKLQGVADQLSNPTAIYKVIWEVYYKAKFNEMIGRVVQNKDSGGIYKITNIVNGKTYIGKTVNFKTRWTTHAKRALRCETFSVNKLYTEMWEQGLYNFSFEIVEVCEKDKQTVQEKFWISYYKSNEFGYNTQT